MRLLRLWSPAHPLWQAPYRIFFLLAGLSAALTPLAFLLPAWAGPEPIAFHRHELLFGMAGAALGGYLLTALPAWTGRGPVRPGVVMVLCLLWLVGRLTFAWRDSLPDFLTALGLTAYLIGLLVVLVAAIGRAGVWHRLVVTVPLAGLAIADLQSCGVIDPAGLAPNSLSAPLAYALLISLIGGRAVPAFTRRWLARSDTGVGVRDDPLPGRIAIAALVVAEILNAGDRQAPAGIVLILSALLQVLRMAGWQSWRARRYPALWLLHLAWLWLPAGLLLAGLARLRPETIDVATAVHGLTIGAMGSMMLAIMARAAMIRRDGLLVAGRAIGAGFACLSLSALTRIGAPWLPGSVDPVPVAALLWMSGWTVFVFSLVPALGGPVPRPVLSA